ncbi:hypothetical protein A2164_03890 [Candidatus Curtissbacteria bacterium RBG_13_35_7]|uniref:DUF192 domain-containing protein n=1 Tax=Candidatus Curtissbacteria bacterium RBG_13_35_7 TaxID=1797705 RepID=A0A1F5G332_9BACT|nr:MAG: hypothetical protein A2164_03890 [Candidatus Curtissbacteria bacterium RBG_13_35_7]
MNLKKDLAIVVGLFLLIAILIVFGKNFTSTTFITNNPIGTRSAQTREATPSYTNGKLNVKINNLTILAEVAKDDKIKTKGLAKRDELPIGEGMLFVFDKSGQHRIWMKDMRFPIDIIWIDSTKKIVDIKQNAVIEPNKDDDALTIYSPKTEALYILEINAGLASLNNLAIGSLVEFEL